MITGAFPCSSKFVEMLGRNTESLGLNALVVLNVIKGIAQEIFSFLAAAFTYFVYGTWFDPKNPDPSKENVLLVHGYLHNSSAWHFHRMKLKDQYNVFTIDLGSLEFRSIETYAERVQDKMREIQRKTGAGSLKMVGHSMGGLVSVIAATADKRGLPNVTHIATLGSPLEGTKLAAIAVGGCGADMRVGSELTQKIKEKFAQNQTIQFLHFSSSMDEIVIPQASARPLHKKAKYVECPYFGHLTYLFSSKVSQEIRDFFTPSLAPQKTSI